MGFYDTDDIDYNARAAQEQAARDAQYRAEQEANHQFNQQMYGSNNSGGDWHVDALCKRIGFTKDDANIVKCEYDCFFQKLFGGEVTSNTPKQYEYPRTSVRDGDPKGVLGLLFKTVRSTYFALEKVPVVNSLKLWAKIDSLILSNSTNPVVKRYLKALEQSQSLRPAYQ